MTALLTRIILYILAGALAVAAAALPGVTFDATTNVIQIDIANISYLLATLVAGAFGGGTFWVSRLVKLAGGLT